MRTTTLLFEFRRANDNKVMQMVTRPRHMNNTRYTIKVEYRLLFIFVEIFLKYYKISVRRENMLFCFKFYINY